MSKVSIAVCVLVSISFSFVTFTLFFCVSSSVGSSSQQSERLEYRSLGKRRAHKCCAHYCRSTELALGIFARSVQALRSCAAMGPAHTPLSHAHLAISRSLHGACDSLALRLSLPFSIRALLGRSLAGNWLPVVLKWYTLVSVCFGVIV